MQQSQLEKLKGLIQTSPILDANERAEWLTLLELMDGKQANELEKILLGAGQEPVKTELKPAARLEQPLPQDKPVQPSFSHILNLPKLEVGEQKLQPAGQAALQNKTAAGKSGGMWQRLKDVLAEKELLPGHPEAVKELELPAPGSTASLSRPGLLKEKIAPTIPKPAPAKSVLEKPVAAFKNLPPLKADLPKVGRSPLTKPLLPLESKVHYYSSLQERVNQEVVQTKTFVPPAPLEIAKAESPIKSPPVLKEKVREKVEQPAKKSAPSTLKNGFDVDIDEFKRMDFGVLVKKFRELIRKSDYHDVIFNLERSPLYKVYLNTGAALLNGQMSFEQLSQKQDEEYLSREQFEKFVDLLRQLQTN